MVVARSHFSTTLSRQNQLHTITLHLDFLRRTEKGPATFTVRDAKLGRQTSTIHISLAQEINNETREEVVGYITNSNLETESGVSFDTHWSLHPSPSSADLSKFSSDIDATWAEQRFMPFAEFRKASQKVKFFFPRQGQRVRSAVDEWIAFNTTSASGRKERFTNESLGFVSDMWPQIIEGHREEEVYDISRQGKDTVQGAPIAKFWYPTVLLNLDVKKALPAEGVEWLFVRVRAKTIKNGRYDLEVVILDEEGDVVALSHQVALCVPAARNLAKRGSFKTKSEGSAPKL